MSLLKLTYDVLGATKGDILSVTYREHLNLGVHDIESYNKSFVNTMMLLFREELEQHYKYNMTKFHNVQDIAETIVEEQQQYNYL